MVDSESHQKNFFKHATSLGLPFKLSTAHIRVELVKSEMSSLECLMSYIRNFCHGPKKYWSFLQEQEHSLGLSTVLFKTLESH